MIGRISRRKNEPSWILLRSASLKNKKNPRLLKWRPLLLGAVSFFVLVSHGFSSEWCVPPRGQLHQIWSKVKCNPKLSDPFFNTGEWSYLDYDLEGIPLKERLTEPPRLKHTAKCFSTSFGGREHRVRYCRAKLLNGNIVCLLIHESNPGFDDRLRVLVRNGKFTCQFWTLFRIRARARPGARWTTTRQKLILNEKVYRPGDVMKGRIDFECVQEIIDPTLMKHYDGNPSTVKLYGVFKTVVE